MYSKKSLKIFVDAYLLNKEPQGTQTYIRELYKEVAKENPNHTFYLGIFYDEQIINLFKEFKNIQFIFFKNKFRLFRMLYEIPKLISDNKFHYAHFQYAIPFKRNSNCKYIVTIHDILFNTFPQYFSSIYRLKRNALFEYSAQKADFLLTVSNYSETAIRERYNLKDKQIHITVNGVHKEFFKSYEKQKSEEIIYKKYHAKNYLLYISRVEPRKNQDFLLKLFLDMDLGKKYELVFIGKNSIKNDRFEKLLSNLPNNVKKRVHYFEEIDTKDLLDFYRGAKVFVFPSKAEGFGIPPIEAGALRIPVLCSNKTAMSDFSFFSPNFVNPDNKKAFEEALKRILDVKDEKHLDTIQKSIGAKYNWESSAKVVSAIINNN